MRSKILLTSVLAMFVVVSIIVVARDVRITVPSRLNAQRATAVEAAPVAKAVARATEPVSVDTSAAKAPIPQQVKTSTRRERETSGAKKIEPASISPPAATQARKIVATYFHGNVRCVTCRKVEAYAREAVEDGFPEAIERGEVEFKAVNVEEPANEHFIGDYQLTNKSVVVAEEVDGKVSRWVKLDQVWSLVNDRTAYYKYVQGAVDSYLGPR